MSDQVYLPGGNLTALEASQLMQWGGDASANSAGTVANATGSDPAPHVEKATKTGPEQLQKPETFLESVLDVLPASLVTKTGFKPTFLYSVALVVIALLVFSRGLGLLGEEGAGVVVDLGDPSKYPGIGHAVRGMKGKK